MCSIFSAGVSRSYFIDQILEIGNSYLIWVQEIGLRLVHTTDVSILYVYSRN